MAYRQNLPVTTLRVAAPQTSTPVRAPAGTEITVTIPDPVAGGSGACTVDYTLSSDAAVQNGTATWVTGGFGTYSSSGTTQKVYGDCWVRVVCTSGSAAVQIDPMGATVAATSNPAALPFPATSSGYVGQQLLTVTIGNSINNGVNQSGTTRNNSGGADPAGWWNIGSIVMHANALADAPLRFGRITATTRADKWGQYANSGALAAAINTDLTGQLYTALDTAGVKPDLIIAVSLLENDIAAGRTTAQCRADLQQWLYTAKGRYPTARIAIGSPLPSFSYDTAAKVLVYQEMKAWILGLDNGRDIFAYRSDCYEDPMSPGKPLAGWTDATVHPTTAGGMRISREGFLPCLRRIAQAALPAYRSTSLNFAATGTAAATGTNVSGTVATGYAHSGTSNGVAVLVANQPSCSLTQTQTAGQLVDAGNLDCGGQHTVSGFTQYSPYIKVRIDSGAENLRAVMLQPRCRDGTTSPFFNMHQGAGSDSDPYVGAYQNGDILTLRCPPITQADAGTAGALTAINTYLRLQLRTAGTGAALGGSATVTVLDSGIGLVA